MKIPEILNNSAYLDSELDYKWDEKSGTFFNSIAENNKIIDILYKINHKATFALATAMGEWIFWRLDKYWNKPRILSIIESHWAGGIDKHYFYGWNFDPQYETDKAMAPLWVTIKCLQRVRENYLYGGFFINDKVDRLAMLARHIAPEPKIFDQWLSDCLARLVELSPAEYDRKEMLGHLEDFEGESYDSSDEPIIPREFFFDDRFDSKSADNKALLNTFLSQMDYKNNPFLNPPEKMLENGFVGTPYVYEGK